MQIFSSKHGAITLEPVAPDNFPAPLIAGSNSFFAKKEYGSILLQEYSTELFSIRYSIFNFSKKISLLFNNENNGLRSLLALQNSTKIRFEKNKTLSLLQDQYVLVNGGSTETITFNKTGEYKLFDTIFSQNLLKQLGSSFPALQQFFTGKAVPPGKPQIKAHRFAPHQLLGHAADILKSPYDESFRKFYFENKIRDFLFDLMVDAAEEKPDTKVSNTESASLQKAKHIILSDISKHFTIQSLSRMVQLNEFKLKTGFKKQYGTGIFECLLEARMNKAKELLSDTEKPIKEIAALIGYDHLTSFITAFRKFFGFTPGSVRRK